MLALPLSEVAIACGGRLENADASSRVSSVATDSRHAGPGALFVALRGEKAHGHDFVLDAMEAGAVAAIVADSYGGDGRLVRVADTLAALGALAEAVRVRLSAKVVAVTGSSGKTTTKDFIAAACASARRTVASPASFNNEIGVPLTVLSAVEDTEVLVVEVGSRGLGHIASLAPIVRPDIAVVTNVGSAHAGMFGSLRETARAKAELVRALGSSGVAVLNADDPHVRKMASESAGSVVTFGLAPGSDVRAEDVVLDRDARASFSVVFGGEVARATLRSPGEHMVPNALGAIAAAVAVGVPLASAAAAVGHAEAAAWRMEVRDVGARRIVNDAYNANPDSMHAALKALVAMANGRPTWAVLGHMAELGTASAAAHDRIGRLVVRLNVGHLLTVGAEARAIHEAARLEGLQPEEAIFVSTPEEAVAVLTRELEPDAVVLVKASRAAGLESIAHALEGIE